MRKQTNNKDPRAAVIALCAALIVAGLVGVLREVSVIILSAWIVLTLLQSIMGLPSPSKKR